MCVMCGYIGSRSAAPLLLAAGKRMEGLWSGYYTGIGVLGPDGVLRSHKTTGCSAVWEQRFSTDDLPGTTGLFHSRTGSGGDSSRAHPFVSADGSVLCVSQGSTGIFSGNGAELDALGNSLLDSGVHFSSADFHPQTRRSPSLKDGSQVHISDLAVETAASACRSCGDPLLAVRETALKIREESVTLYLFRDRPGHIYIANMNQRMCVCFSGDGAHLSTCALAFGTERRRLIEVPPDSVSDVTAETFSTFPLSKEFSVDTRIPCGLRESVLRWIRENPGTLLAHVTDHAAAPLFPGGGLEMRAAATYGVFEELYYDGLLNLKTVFAPGVGEDRSIRTLISLKGNN